MISTISNALELPVTRKAVLERAKEFRKYCLCYSICLVLDKYNIVHDYKLIKYFPKFTRKNALQFAANRKGDWWWNPNVWNTGRMAFLDWLIEQYKDDKTDLRKL